MGLVASPSGSLSGLDGPQLACRCAPPDGWVGGVALHAFLRPQSFPDQLPPQGAATTDYPSAINQQ